jgi:molybdopterin molybdotransferase
MKSIEEAQREIHAAFAPLASERLPLLDALDRFLATSYVARHPAPPFDSSAMDGYAVHSGSLRTASADAPACLAVIGESRAGGAPPSALEEGAAMRIFTGAMIPAGADAVVLQEDVERRGDSASFSEPARLASNIRKRGEDLREGQPLLARGARIGSGEIALLASQEVATVEVYRKPKVAILCTGDELREIGEPARPGSIINSNAYGLYAQVREAGAEPWLLPAVADTREAVRASLERALRADLIVISGGVSVGDYDVVHRALTDLDIALALWKVRMKPGKPVSFGVKNGVPILGLPGNPVSTWVTFELFARPGLRTMLGDPKPQRSQLLVRLDKVVDKPRGRPEVARGSLRYDADGGARVQLRERQGSGAISSLADVDVLVLLPEGAAPIGLETRLHAWLLRGAAGGPG